MLGTEREQPSPMPKGDAFMSASLKPPARMTVAEFLDWPDDPTGAVWQLVDGEPVMMAPSSDIHGTIQTNLASLLRVHLRATRPGCRVVTGAGIRPSVRPDHNVRIPDLIVTCEPARPGVHLTPRPVLLVEILSPSNQAHTWSNVWTYTTIPTVQEILVLQSTDVAGELLRRTASGTWPERFARVGPTLDLASVGAVFPLAEVYYDVAFDASP